MSGAMSLEKSVRTCDVNVGEANRIQSDRFFNPYNMVCIPWNGLNNKGQVVAPDSFYTKTPGCNSAEDRVMVENAQRPNYMSYVTLGAQGIQGNIYGNMEAKSQAMGRDNMVRMINNDGGAKKHPQWGTGGTGNFGKQFGANVDFHGCTVSPDGATAYERAMQQVNTQMRNQNYLQQGFLSYDSRMRAGGY